MISCSDFMNLKLVFREKLLRRLLMIFFKGLDGKSLESLQANLSFN